MSDQATHIAPVPAPRIPTGQELFDALMSHIEPELTTEGLKAAAGKYTAETAEDKEARRRRYAEAFERYEQAYEGYMATLHSQVLRFKKASFERVELEDRARENTLLGGIDQSILANP